MAREPCIEVEFEMRNDRTFEERIRWLLMQARSAEARGDGEVAHNLRALARDLGPAPVESRMR